MTDQKKGAVREQVAVCLVLRLPERQLAVPEVGGAGQKRSGLAVRSSLVSGEIRPGDEPKLSASATALTNHSHRRGSGPAAAWG